MSGKKIAVQGMTVFSSPGQRSIQEDFAISNREKGIFVVADGFGGPEAGVAASKTACESVRGFLEREARDLDATLPFVLRSYFSLAGNVLFNALIFANRKLMGLNHKKNVHEKGGASVIAGYLDGNLLAIANVGGCSAWLCREGKAVELVMPRTLGRLRDPFNPTRMEGAGVPLMALGMAEDLEPEIFEVQVQPRDWLLFQTDGVSSVTREAIWSLQGQSASLQEAGDAFKELALEDNAVATLISF